MYSRASFSTLLISLALAGCAESRAQRPVDGGLTGVDEPVQGEPDASSDASTGPVPSADAATDDAGSNERPDAGTSDASTADASTEPCVAMSSCGAPIMLGAVSGDTGADVLTTEGLGPAFVAVQVSEDDHGILGVDLEVHATLESPNGANFDLVAFAEQDACATASDSATSQFDDIVDVKWSDGRGDDSGRTVVFQVLSAGGACPAAMPWKLQVRGN